MVTTTQTPESSNAAVKAATKRSPRKSTATATGAKAVGGGETTRRPSRKADINVIEGTAVSKPGSLPSPDVVNFNFAGRTATVAEALGGMNKVADLLQVSRSQPTRWRQGAEQPSPQAARLLIDLDHVLARAQLVFTPKVARQWLVGSNSYLNGARPIDILRLRGSTQVIEALDAAWQGSFS